MRRATVVAAVLLALVGCGDDSGEDTATTTTTVEPNPEEAFRSELETGMRDARLQSTDPGFYDDAADLARTVCDIAADTPTAIEQDDAANDTPESDAAIADVSVTIGLASVVDGLGDDELAGIFMDATSKHICPEHADTIDGFMAAR